MPGVTKAAATGRQTQLDPPRPVVTNPKTQPVKKRSKASSTPKLSADAHDASSCHVIVREATSSRNMSPEKSPETIPRPFEKVTTSLEKHKSRAAVVTSVNYEVSKPLLSDSGPPAAYRSPANPGSVTGPYPFGWDAEPTRARVNEVCRRFLMGQCSRAANCDRIHPRGDGVRKHAPDAQVFVVKLPIQQPPPRPGVRLALQADAVSQVPSDIPRPHTLPLPSGVKSGAPLRYDPNRGILPYQAESDGGQTSDSSQYFSAKSSPVGSSCSLTSEDTETTKAPMHPPPPSIYLCRRWLMNECKRSHDCSFVHGDLEYDPPVRGVYPSPRYRTRCRRGSCSRGYLCEYLHDDLKYGKPFDELPSSKSACGSTDFPSSRPPLDGDATTVQGALKEEKAVVNVGRYPPPKSNHFCRNWLRNRCFRGPACFFFHGDVEYDPPTEGIHPPPRYPHICKLSLLHECFLGFACDFTHEDLQYDTPTPREALQKPREYPQRSRECLPRVGTRDPGEGKHRRPRFAETCQNWIRERCQKGYSCHYIHLDLVYDDTPSGPLINDTSSVDNSVNDPPVGMRPPPKSPDTCIQWLRDKCTLRYACKYRHDDLDYDPSSDRRSPDVSTALSIAGNGYASTEVRAWSVKVHDYAEVKLGPGFEIQELETGFETPWIYLGNIPARATAEDVADLLRPFGEVLDVRLPTRVSNPTMLVRARFLSPAEAREAGTSLNGAHAFGCKISARLPVHDASRHNAMFEDTAVRIRWEAPSKVGYGGYSTMEHAKAALEASRKPFGDHYVHAAVHVGLPVVGVVTVRFRGLPLDTSKEDMAWFAKPDDVVWARPNYRNLDLATQGIKRILQEGTELLDFVVLPPPYRSGARVQGWALFATPSDAKAACGRVHGCKPVFTGKTKVFAEHVQSLTFHVSPAMYGKVGDDIQALCRTVYHARRTAMSVVQRPTPMQTLVKLSGDDIKELGQLKAELEKILKGEAVRQGQNVAWDPFFAHPAGKAFLEGIEREVPAITVLVDVPKRMIRLLGSSRSRSIVRTRILSKMTELQSQQTHTIPLDGWLLGQFMGNDLAPLQIQFGRENVNLDMRNRRLIIRGSDAAYETAREAVRRARQAQFHPGRRHRASECPVCFDEVTSPVKLPCGHSWCRDCISRYLLSAIDNKFFPVTCLGGDAKCTEHIPLQIARKFLTISQFDAIVDAALAFYIHSRPDEFHHCPTPDCPQFYRSAPRETVLQCPSCLLRICPSCHVEAHDGFSCPDPEGDNNLFREWMGNHDVKPCPGCKVLIERAEGCHHMTCTQCKTHICWVCLQTFPRGDGIYDHMRALHGGIGLGAD